MKSAMSNNLYMQLHCSQSILSVLTVGDLLNFNFFLNNI